MHYFLSYFSKYWYNLASKNLIVTSPPLVGNFNTLQLILFPAFHVYKAHHITSLKTLLVAYLTNKTRINSSNFRNTQQKNFPVPSLSLIRTFQFTTLAHFYENFYLLFCLSGSKIAFLIYTKKC